LRGLDIQKAKDFIWDHLTEIAQNFMVTVSQMSEDDRVKLYAKQYEVYLKSGEIKDGVIVKEFAMLYPQQIFDNSNRET
jgi:hypothetical protein